MSGPLRVTAGEVGTDEIVAALEDGRSVIVTTEVLGSEQEVTLRRDDEVYYCDTPTTLHTHESLAEMRECIEKHGYGSD